MIKITGISLSLILCSQVWAASTYPQKPEPSMTPGSYCPHADEFRYPEHIAYCKRNVSTGRKNAIIEDYNQHGYRIERSDRSQFKIDHYIPLCAGGSNEDSNLWPQHQSVYNITDPLEGLACERMKEGKLLQKRAVELLIRAKQNLSEAPAVQEILESL